MKCIGKLVGLPCDREARSNSNYCADHWDYFRDRMIKHERGHRWDGVIYFGVLVAGVAVALLVVRYG